MPANSRWDLIRGLKGQTLGVFYKLLGRQHVLSLLFSLQLLRQDFRIYKNGNGQKYLP